MKRYSMTHGHYIAHVYNLWKAGYIYLKRTAEILTVTQPTKLLSILVI